MKKVVYSKLTRLEKEHTLARPRLRDDFEFKQQVEKIITAVKEQGDAALKQFSLAFDKVALNTIQIDSSTFEQTQQLPAKSRLAIDDAYQNIHAFHAAQQIPPLRVETLPGVVCEKIMRPIQKVGLYIPGGSAPLLSTVLMLGIPAQIANCPVRVVCTPPNQHGSIDPHILYAAQKCGIDTVYALGGAQAIAAMAYGTESVLKVDKIFGPGNAYVTQAKQQVAQDPMGASIDMPAGPSEVMVIADEKANPSFVAADLLSQAEHGPDSQVILMCLSDQFADKVLIEIEKLLASLPRQDIAKRALAHSVVIIVDELSDAVAISNHYAPEHLIIQTETARALLPKITCAGSVFLGRYAPESVGDYASGTNHVLPTYGYARNHSGLSLKDFMLQISVQELTASGLAQLGPTVEVLAHIEGLQAHALAVSLRLQEINNDR